MTAPVQADRDAARAAHGLGRLITLTTAATTSKENQP